MSWIESTLWWYVILMLLGVVFMPLTKLFFGKFFDSGYPFAKIIGILLISYAAFIGGILHILPFSSLSLFGLLIIGLIFNVWLYQKKQMSFSREQITIMVAEEIIFCVGLFFWAFVRAQEPSIRGLEKFMDYGFMNSILRSDYFPPKDMWLAGKSINYYYFGHLMGAVLTKLSHLPSAITYNLILATIFALGTTQTFSLCFNIVLSGFKKIRLAVVGAVLGLFLVNFAGNLHTFYSFTKGYPNEKPQAPWTFSNPKIGCIVKDANGKDSWTLFCPQSYWYPNATRFIPFTIHEFPIYSYVVADLHGHVFGIPLVLLTIAALYIMYTAKKTAHEDNRTESPGKGLFYKTKQLILANKRYLAGTGLIGFLTAVNYMTNAFDGPIYTLLSLLLLFAIYKLSLLFFAHLIILSLSFLVFSLPFSAFFEPFVSGIGVNCSPAFLTKLQKAGPFIFEAGNCQLSAWWMLVLLWGFFWFNFVFFVLYHKQKVLHVVHNRISMFMLLLFSYGTLLILIPEFFYIKDIYPAHFRANTMFKMGYQAFIMMGIASTYVVMMFKNKLANKPLQWAYYVLFSICFVLVAIYPYFAVTSYYGRLTKVPEQNGTTWLATTFTEYQEIIEYLNKNIKGQPTILEAQGDSYTDYNVVSSYTGLPTVAGWMVHQWLWRGDPAVVSNLSPDIQKIYETTDQAEAQSLVSKYQIKYIIIGTNEKEKYKGLDYKKFGVIGKEIFSTTDGKGKIFEIL